VSLPKPKQFPQMAQEFVTFSAMQTLFVGVAEHACVG
jgi:hypothetical protein